MPINAFLTDLINISPDGITLLVIIVCGLLFVLPLFSGFFRRLRGIAPSLMISFGILGTFWGTLIALNGFNTGGVTVGEGGGINHSAMVESIPLVLSGMKSAFVTSLIGLLSAFVYRLIYPYIPADQPAQQELLPVEKSYLDMLQAIKEAINGEKDNSLFMQLNRMQGEIRGNAQELKDILGGQNESSLMAQLNLFRNESAGKFDAIRAVISEQSGKLENVNREIGELNNISRELKDIIGGQDESSILSELKSLRGESSSKLDAISAAISERSEQLAQQLENINRGIGELNNRSHELKDIIGGQDESSILSELKSLRDESSSKLDAINQHMAGLAETIRESLVKNLEDLITEIKTAISEQLVEQLKETNNVLRRQMEDMIRRIEEALIEQFGATFEEFNEATQAIKAWQEQHTQQVEQLTEAFRLCVGGIENIQASCEQIQASCRAIPDSVEQLNVIMGELDSRLKAFADLKERAEESLPVIKRHLDQIGEDLKDSAYGLSATIEAMRGNIESEHEALTQQINGFVTRMGEVTEQHAGAINGVVEDIARQWGDQVVSITNHVAGRIGRDRR